MLKTHVLRLINTFTIVVFVNFLLALNASAADFLLSENESTQYESSYKDHDQSEPYQLLAQKLPAQQYPFKSTYPKSYSTQPATPVFIPVVNFRVYNAPNPQHTYTEGDYIEYYARNRYDRLRTFTVSNSVPITTYSREMPIDLSDAPCSWGDFYDFWHSAGPPDPSDMGLSDGLWWIERDAIGIVAIEQQWVP